MLVGQAVVTAKGVRVVVAELVDVDSKALQEAAIKLQAALGDSGAVVLGARGEGKANFVAAFSDVVRRVGAAGQGGPGPGGLLHDGAAA